MKYFYSPSTNGFYLSAVHAEIPDDAKEISEDLYKTLLQSGGQIESDADGMPMPAQHRAATVAELACASQAQVDAEYTRRMGELANNYPAHERESWPVQLAEAQALQADANATTPWIDQCAAARGLDRVELAARILQKDAAYRQVSGLLTGIRQWHEDQISALLEAGEASRQALQAYDTTQGWPTTDLREPQPA